MTVVIGLVAVAAVGYLIACLVVGLGPAPPLERFASDSDPLVKHFTNSPASTVEAYRAAVGMTAGMRVVEHRQDVLLIDSRPTPRVIDGNFGMVILIRFAGDDNGCVATAEAMNKVPFAVTSNHDAAFVAAERALRMTAKIRGLEEVLPNAR